MTTSSAVDSGMTDFGETLGLVEATVAIFGMTLMDGDQEARAVDRGAVHQVVEALAALVHMVDHGALTEVAAAVHGGLLEAATTPSLTEEVSVEEIEVALAPAVWAEVEVTLVACHEEVLPSAEVPEALSRAAYLELAHSI